MDVYHLRYDDNGQPIRKRKHGRRPANFHNKRKKLIRCHKGKTPGGQPICGYCGQVILGIRITLDHIIPISKGGSDAIENLVLACPECNGAKGDSIKPILYGPKKGHKGEKKHE